MKNDKEFLISPDLENDNLTKEIEGFNEAGEYVKLPVVKEIPLTIYLNKQEIVTAMTLGDMPDLLAVGYLLNQNMLKKNDVISEVTYDEELQVVIVRTKRKTNYEEKMEKKMKKAQKIPFWSEDPNVLFKQKHIFEFYPVASMSYEQKLNAITRLVVLLIFLSYLYSGNFRILLIGLVTIFAIFLMHYFLQLYLFPCSICAAAAPLALQALLFAGPVGSPA